MKNFNKLWIWHDVFVDNQYNSTPIGERTEIRIGNEMKAYNCHQINSELFENQACNSELAEAVKAEIFYVNVY